MKFIKTFESYSTEHKDDNIVEQILKIIKYRNNEVISIICILVT